MINLYYEKKKVVVQIKNFKGELHQAKVNFLKLFSIEHSLYVGGYTFIDKYPYDEGSGFYMFKLNSETGELTPLIDLLSPPSWMEGVDLIGD